MMEECRPVIEKIVKDKQISNDEFIFLWKNSEYLKENILCKNAFSIS